MQNDFLNDGISEMKSRLHKHLPALFALAEDHSEAGRMALADKLAQVFLTHTVVLTPHEEVLVNELIGELLKSESDQARHVLIEHFADAMNAPRHIALRVVSGPAEIAFPVLKSNENLLDDDLIAIVESKSHSYAAAIAERKIVSEAVADALVTTGDFQVMQIVAENLGAKLSTKALNIIVDAARLTAMLQEPILNRPELSPENAAHLFWWTAQDMRRTILERFGFGPGKLDIELKKAIDEKLYACILQKDNEDAMETLADWLDDRQAITVSILPQLLRIGHYRLFNVLLSRLANLDMPLIESINSEKGARYMVALCKAIGIDKGNFVSIYLMAHGSHNEDQVVQPRELAQALAAYDRLDLETAETMLQTWRISPEALLSRDSNQVAQEA